MIGERISELADVLILIFACSLLALCELVGLSEIATRIHAGMSSVGSRYIEEEDHAG